mgnify:CR=1 FL=1
MADHQTEKAFQQQAGVFLNKKKYLSENKKAAAKIPRYYKKIGLGYLALIFFIFIFTSISIFIHFVSLLRKKSFFIYKFSFLF